MAQLLRMGWFRPVHCKSAPAQEVRATVHNVTTPPTYVFNGIDPLQTFEPANRSR